MRDTRGCRLVAAERNRQIQAEGWSADHDDEHGDGSLVDAAICYAQVTDPDQYGGGNPPPGWPWLAKYWRPGPPIRMLVKAAALLVADIDRRLRAGEGRDLDAAPDCITTLTAERDAALAERDALRRMWSLALSEPVDPAHIEAIGAWVRNTADRRDARDSLTYAMTNIAPMLPDPNAFFAELRRLLQEADDAD